MSLVKVGGIIDMYKMIFLSRLSGDPHEYQLMKYFYRPVWATFVFLILWLFTGVGQQSQAAESTSTLTLLESYSFAQQHDSQIAAARSTRDAGRESLVQGRSGLRPTIVLGADYLNIDRNIRYDNLTPGLTSTSMDLDHDSNSYSINLIQPLFRLQNLAQYRLSKALVASAEDSFVIAQQNLILRVTQAYFSVLIAEESLVAAKAQTEANSESLVEAKTKFEVGTVTRVDVDEAQAGYDLARADEIAVSNDLNVNRQSLKKIIGQTPPNILASAKGLLPAILQPNDMQQWENFALASSPVIRLAQNQLTAAQQVVASNRGARYPTVDFVASYHDTSTDGINLAGSGSDTTDAIVGIQLEIPLYTGGSNSSKVREAVANQMTASHNLREAREQVALDTRQAYLNVTSGHLRMKALQQAVKSRESALETTRRSYEVGSRTSLDVINAQQQLFEISSNLASAKYSYLNSILQLKAAAGVLSEDDLEAISRLLK